MTNLDRMKQLVDTCPWLNADNILAAATDNMAWQDRVADCWRDLLRNDSVANQSAAIALWNGVGVNLTLDFVQKVFNAAD
jgi:hypothetical protein